MKAYLFNLSNQNQVLNVRIPEVGKMSVPVDSMKPKLFPKDLNMPQFKALIDQQRKYGMLTVEEAMNHRPGSSPVVWIVNLDKEVPPNVIRDTINKNTGVLTEQGQEMRRMAALATRHNMIDQARTPSAADHVELSIEEEPGKGQTNTSALVAEGYRVDPNAKQSEAPTGRRGGRRGR